MVYKKNFINKVIIRLDFAEPHILFNSEYFPKFKDSFKAKYEDVELETRLIQSFEFKLESAQSTQDIKTIGQLGIFKFANNTQLIELDLTHFSITSSIFSEFKDFSKPFEYGIGILKLDHKIPDIKRVGLRFINVIKHEEIKEIKDWSNYINEAFLPSYGNILKPFSDTNYTLRRNINEFYFSDGDLLLHLRIGLWNSKFPSIISDNELIIDIDCYSNILTNVDNIVDKIMIMDHAAYKLFRNIILPKLESLMNGVE